MPHSNLGVLFPSLMSWVARESLRLGCQDFADESIRRVASKRLQPLTEVVEIGEVHEMMTRLIVAVVEPLHSRVVDGPVPPLELASGP